jgi:anti-anti-sigma factor
VTEHHGAPGAEQDAISFAECGGAVVIRVSGRGSFANSVELKRISDHFFDKQGSQACRFIIDLDDCQTMDSTFMGVLASIGLRQKRDSGELMAIVNVNAQNVRLLQTLGLAHFMHVRPKGAAAPDTSGASFQTAQKEDVSKVDRIVHMIEAHETLCDADSGNAVEFDKVLRFLRESLEREKGA